MIEVTELTKRYGQNVAVDNVSFRVSQGEILGFLGPNGAGKSTTMNILTGYLSATEGSCKINGFDVLENAIEARKCVGYLPEQPPLYLDMTVKDYLDFIYDLKKVKLPRNEHIQEVCRTVKIDGVYHRLIKNLSKGYRQRVGIAQAMIGNPEVLILDEPTVGLDPKQIIEIRSLIKSLGEKHTVILSSHILSEVQAVCDRVVVINHGKVVADDTTANLSHNMSNDHRYTALIDGPENEVLKTLRGIAGMKAVQELGRRENGVHEYQIEAEEGKDIRREIFKRLAERSWPLLGLRSSELSLEDIFLKLTNENAAVLPERKKAKSPEAPSEAVEEAAEAPEAPQETADEPAAEAAPEKAADETGKEGE